MKTWAELREEFNALGNRLGHTAIFYQTGDIGEHWELKPQTNDTEALDSFIALCKIAGSKAAEEIRRANEAIESSQVIRMGENLIGYVDVGPSDHTKTWYRLLKHLSGKLDPSSVDEYFDNGHIVEIADGSAKLCSRLSSYKPYMKPSIVQGHKWAWRVSNGMKYEDINKPCFVIYYKHGDNQDKTKWTRIARIDKPLDGVFPVSFVNFSWNIPQSIVECVVREINYYLVELDEQNPWQYMLHHCNSAANIYSQVHWEYCESGE